MKRFVLDSSVTMAWCFEDEKTNYSEEILSLLSEGVQAIVPSLWPYEVLNVLIGAQRRKRITHAQAINFWNHLQALPIVPVQSDHKEWALDVITLAHQYDLSSYDTTYLELALREGAALATLDEKLRKAAHAAGVATKYMKQ